jgi:hypothetical protein
LLGVPGRERVDQESDYWLIFSRCIAMLDNMHKGNYVSKWVFYLHSELENNLVVLMDPTDLIGIALGTAVACSPLVLLAYRRTEQTEDEKGVLASFSGMLVSTAPMVILFALHIAVVVAAVFLARAHWSSVFGHGDQPGWWLWGWTGLFLTQSHLALHRSTVTWGSTSLFARVVLALMVLNLIAFFAPYLPNENRNLLLGDNSFITLCLLFLLLLVSAGMQMRSGAHVTSKAASPQFSIGLKSLRLRKQIDELTAALGAQQAFNAEMEGERNHLSEELTHVREREVEMGNSLDQYQLKLAEAEVERNRLDQELRLALDRGQDARKQLEIARMVHDATTKSVGEERMRMEQELQDARTREKELLTTMKKLSLAVTLLRRRAGKAQTHSAADTFDRSSNAEAYYAHILGMYGEFSARALKERHRELVLQNHPDRVEAMDPAIREFAEVRMTEVNEAFQYFKRKMGM